MGVRAVWVNPLPGSQLRGWLSATLSPPSALHNPSRNLWVERPGFINKSIWGGSREKKHTHAHANNSVQTCNC